MAQINTLYFECFKTLFSCSCFAMEYLFNQIQGENTFPLFFSLGNMIYLNQSTSILHKENISERELAASMKFLRADIYLKEFLYISCQKSNVFLTSSASKYFSCMHTLYSIKLFVFDRVSQLAHGFRIQNIYLAYVQNRDG